MVYRREHSTLHYKRFAVTHDGKTETFSSKKLMMDYLEKFMRELYCGEEVTLVIKHRTLKEVTGENRNEMVLEKPKPAEAEKKENANA